MDRRAARRVVSAGALLALTVWMGGLPAAAADDPVTDTPTAAAPAVSSVGEDPTTDVTSDPEPSPSVEPADPAPNPQPTPSSEPTPTPEPSTPGGGNGEQPQQPTPVAEPTPTPTAEPPTPDVRPTPRTSPVTTQIRRGHNPDETQAAATIVIGDFDCQSLTTTVTLDNSASSSDTTLTVRVGRWVAGVYEPYSRQDVAVDPGQVEHVIAELAPDAFSEVTASGGGGYVTREGICGSYVLDPRAAIQDMDCSALQASVTLDNSRSTDLVLFSVDRVSRGEIDPWQTSYHDEVAVSAGQQVTVLVPLAQPALNRVTVSTGPPLHMTLATSDDTICGALAGVSIGPLDCGSLSTLVTLDNTRVGSTTAFAVHAGDLDNFWNDLTWKVDWTIEVAAGTVRSVTVPLSDNAPNFVQVSAPGVWAEQSLVCGTVVMDPRATIGEFDCDSLEVPVTLDNSGSSASAAFNVFRMDSNMDSPNDVTYVLAGGETRVQRVRLTDDAATEVWVSPGYPTSPDPEIARARGPVCGLVSVSSVDCHSMTVSVTLQGFDSPYGGRDATYLVSSTKYPAVATAYAKKVTVADRATKVVQVPVASLLGGDLRVQEVDASQVTYEEPVVVDCSGSSGSSGNGRSTSSGDAEALAATGADGLPQLVLGGLLMLTVGGVLLRVGREPRA